MIRVAFAPCTNVHTSFPQVSLSRNECAQRHNAPANVTRRSTPTMIRFPWQKDPNAPKITLNFDVGYAYLAHPEKNTGEDAFFVEGNSAGVFDGVSGAYETRGVDPRRYSQRLAAITQVRVRELGAAAAVRAAYDAAELNDQVGASTACVVGMDEFGRVFGINLGDSGVRIVRGDKLVFRTKEQQHFFNCPYQLGTDSEDMISMGQNVQQKVRDGDWIILATDGLFDNVPDPDIVRQCATADQPMQLADVLADVATENSINKAYPSPFMRAAAKANVPWKGGKVDDITIVAIRVKDDAAIKPQTLLSVLPDVEESPAEEPLNVGSDTAETA